MNFRCVALAFTALTAAVPAFAGEQALIEITDLRPGALETRAFELDRAQDVHIAAVGPASRFRDEAWGDAWILDAGSREVVWELRDAGSSYFDHDLREYEDDVSLPPGSYEVYYAVLPLHPRELDEDGFIGRVIYAFTRSEDDLEEAVEKARLEVRGEGRALTADALAGLRDARREAALVDLTGLGDESSVSRGFELTQRATVAVDAVGEVLRDDGYDYGWIVDLGTRRRVWTFDYHHSEPAGGARKNRKVHTSLDLPAGRYAAFFITDGSHSPQDWNALPPHDPDAWGMTLRLAESDSRVARSFDYDLLPEDEVLVELTRLRDDGFESRGFTLKQPADLRVFAVGEGRGGEMYDYGWIVEARTRRRVWEMSYRDSEHAGGADKNRVVDEIVHLAAGSYLVGFVTDDSHAYRHWNSDPPAWPERWGITLLAPGPGFDRSLVADYEPAQDPAVLARIGPVRDRRHEEERFSLDRSSKVRVYALGEGDDGRMYDYGWIEDARGRVIWEMSYRLTEKAGGAEKNRKFDGTLALEPGEYAVHYESDGSHAFGDWNAAPPYDPEGWGIQIALADAP